MLIYVKILKKFKKKNFFTDGQTDGHILYKTSYHMTHRMSHSY